ncbi:thioredoxin H9-like [Apium graveolens]|uniref:thioredoxin H9-like n=1 Tax=Apium graveolens TaxID=4045 RepID=UPI003D7B530D
MGHCVSKPSTRDNDDDHFSKEKLGASNITLVTDVDVWEEKLSEADEAGKIALVNFSADWCTPCRDVLPVFRSLAEQYTSLMFLIVDVDELPDLSTSWEIKATPTFFFLKDGCELDKLVGANKEELRRRTEVMANPSTSSRSFVSGSPDKPSSQRRTDEDTKPPNQRETDENATTQEIDKPSSQRTDDKAKVQNVNQPSNQRTTDDKTKMQ